MRQDEFKSVASITFDREYVVRAALDLYIKAREAGDIQAAIHALKTAMQAAGLGNDPRKRE